MSVTIYSSFWLAVKFRKYSKQYKAYTVCPWIQYYRHDTVLSSLWSLPLRKPISGTDVPTDDLISPILTYSLNYYNQLWVTLRSHVVTWHDRLNFSSSLVCHKCRLFPSYSYDFLCTDEFHNARKELKSSKKSK